MATECMCVCFCALVVSPSWTVSEVLDMSMKVPDRWWHIHPCGVSLLGGRWGLGSKRWQRSFDRLPGINWGNETGTSWASCLLFGRPHELDRRSITPPFIIRWIVFFSLSLSPCYHLSLFLPFSQEVRILISFQIHDADSFFALSNYVRGER